jgi:hypothetical protein
MASLTTPSASTTVSEAEWIDTARSVSPTRLNLPRTPAPDFTGLKETDPLESVCNRSTKGRFAFGSLPVDVNKLVIVGGIGEPVNHGLIDQ